MGELSKFCTCTDLACPLHPTNHDKGCGPCVAKNMKDKEIPSCFFKLVDADYKGGSYYFEDFAKLVNENAEKKPEETVLQKGKYVLKGLNLARIDAIKKAKETVGEKDVVDTIIDVGSKTVINVGTFAIKRAERLLKKDKDTE